MENNALFIERSHGDLKFYEAGRGAQGCAEGAAAALRPAPDSLPVSNTGLNGEYYVNPVTGVNIPWFSHLQEDGRVRYRYFRCGCDLTFGMVYPKATYPNLKTLDTAPADAAFVDWLTIVFECFDTEVAIAELDSLLREHLNFGIWKPVLDRNGREVGLSGYERSYLLEDGVTRFAIGGNSQRSTARTFYVGNRARGKQARVYEKGKQLGSLTHDSYHNWTRIEVELHGSRLKQGFRSANSALSLGMH